MAIIRPATGREQGRRGVSKEERRGSKEKGEGDKKEGGGGRMKKEGGGGNKEEGDECPERPGLEPDVISID